MSPTLCKRQTTLTLPILFFFLHLITAKTTLHYYSNTDCHPGSLLSSTTLASLKQQHGGLSACHTTPDNTSAIRIDAVDDDSAITPFFGHTCTQPMTLPLFATSKCWAFDAQDQIGSWQGLSGLTVPPSSMNAGASESSYVGLLTESDLLMSPTAAGTMRDEDGMGAAAASTTTINEGSAASAATTPGLQNAASGGAGNGSEGRFVRLAIKALMAMGSAEVTWSLMPV